MEVFFIGIQNFVEFIFPEQTVIHKNTEELITNSFVNQSGNHRWIHATWEAANYFIVTNLFSNALNLRFDEWGRSPVSLTTWNVNHKILENLFPLFGMNHFRMKLNSVDLFFFVPYGSDRCICSMSNHFISIRQIMNMITMTHPNHGIILYIFQESGVIINNEFCTTKFSFLCFLNTSWNQCMCKRLQSVTNTQNRFVKIKIIQIQYRGFFIINTFRTAG